MNNYLLAQTNRQRWCWLLLMMGLAWLTACGGIVPAVTDTPPPTGVQTTPLSGVAIVATDTAILRSAPDVNAERVATLSRNDVVVLLARTADGDWREVIPAGSTTRGWVGAEFLAFVTPTATGEAAGAETPAAAGTTDALPTATASNTPSGGPLPSATPSNTPGPLPTATPSNTPGPAPSATPSSTPRSRTPTPSGPLSFTFSVTWRIDPNNPSEAIATVTINATGGAQPYRYYHDGLLQSGRIFEYRWRICQANPTSFRVDSADGQSRTENWFGQPPCPPPTPTNTATVVGTVLPAAPGTPRP